MKISKLIPEGTVVKEGDFVAELDKTEIMNQVKDVELSIKKNESEFLQARLDSTLNLSAARDEMDNLNFSLEEKKLQLEQSKFEAPSIIRQTEIDYQRTQHTYDQALKNYATKVKKSIATLNIVGTDLSKEQQHMALITQVLDKFTIKAPANGMVIYARDWGGRRKIVGSTISSWDPVVATLPDLKSMESITYVNEIDIQKVKVGQFVRLSLDADSKKKLSGVVEKVANIGEQKPNSDSKVFEVVIKVNEADTTLRPSMTTSNQISVAKVDNVIYVPLECIHTENINNKNINYVFKKSGSKIIKQQVELGLMNENDVIITKGISQEDALFLSHPANPNDIKLTYLK
jgi:multidrug resistance efflux pump